MGDTEVRETSGPAGIDEAKCAPAGVAGTPIAVARAQGGFGSAQGTVDLKCRLTGETGSMVVIQWFDKVIVARIPATAPGNPPYMISVSGGTYTTGDVIVLGPPGSGYPPMQQ